MDAPRRGPKEERGVTVERIVVAARACFAEQGWAGTSLRGVARAAGVDARLVSYYFADKTALLQACLQPPPGFAERVAAAASAPLDRRGAALLEAMLANWNDPASAVVLRSVILTAAHEPLALQQLQSVFRTALIGVVAGSLNGADGPGGEERAVRAGLVASQIVGLFMTRYVWRIPPLSELPDEKVFRLVAPTVQRYLDGPLDR
ncbi:TetR family transcriptional regulator [Nakamurella flava]|nr:TetR family transcriptional regulator [Nakamurella flava]